MEKLRMFVAQEPVVAASCLIAGIGQYLLLSSADFNFFFSSIGIQLCVYRIEDRDIVESYYQIGIKFLDFPCLF